MPAYQTDLPDQEWNVVNPYLPQPSKRDRPREISFRMIINAVFYVVKTGCQWRMLPHCFPKWSTVYYYFRRWKYNELWKKINDKLREEIRIKEGRERQPSATIIDSHTVESTKETVVRGYDGGKKTVGTKRHIMVDVLGLLLLVVVHSAGIQDRDGAKNVFEKAKAKDFSRLSLVWAYGTYAEKLVQWVNNTCGWILDIVQQKEKHVFKALPLPWQWQWQWQWIVERTFGWMNRSRHLSKDYERLSSTSEAWFHETDAKKARMNFQTASKCAHPALRGAD